MSGGNNNNAKHGNEKMTIKRTSKPSVECPKKLSEILKAFRGSEVTIGNGKQVWTLTSGHICGTGGYSKERGVYPSAVVLLKRRTNNGIVSTERHLNQIKLVQN